MSLRLRRGLVRRRRGREETHPGPSVRGLNRLRMPVRCRLRTRACRRGPRRRRSRLHSSREMLPWRSSACSRLPRAFSRARGGDGLAWPRAGDGHWGGAPSMRARCAWHGSHTASCGPRRSPEARAARAAKARAQGACGGGGGRCSSGIPGERGGCSGRLSGGAISDRRCWLGTRVGILRLDGDATSASRFHVRFRGQMRTAVPSGAGFRLPVPSRNGGARPCP
jgi:hypothetical protein